MTDSDVALYDERFQYLAATARNLQAFLHDILADVPRIDRISCRAKDPARFAQKAAKVSESGQRKYVSPLTQIQDQIGARVVVFYQNDVETVAQLLERYLRVAERQNIIPDSEWKFGYFGRHWIFALLDDVIPNETSRDHLPRFFELQVKTLFQHAWSEANHDLCYKAEISLSSDQERRFAFTAAQAWGADRVFEDLRGELADVR